MYGHKLQIWIQAYLKMQFVGDYFHDTHADCCVLRFNLFQSSNEKWLVYHF